MRRFWRVAMFGQNLFDCPITAFVFDFGQNQFEIARFAFLTTNPLNFQL